MPHELAHPDIGRCLNCGADLNGAFCAACGQRSVPANPTVSELAGDAWHELSGYDGRIAETFRNLLRPGRLTIDYIEGRRARYLSPVRLYLTVSVLYFLIAAAAPPAPAPPGTISGPAGMKIGVTDTSGNASRLLTAEDRAEALKNVDSAPWFVRPMLQAILADPDAFRARVLTIMPRVFFALLPVFAAIVALFYRGRRFPTALVFAVHLHAFAFIALALGEAAKFSRSAVLAAGVGAIAMLVLAVYALRSLRAVFGGSWPKTIAKAAGIGLVYSLSSVPAFLIIFIWASLT